MRSKNRSSMILRLLVLIAGAIVVLEALHFLTISVSLTAFTADLKSTRNVPEVLVGLVVGLLALIPTAKREKQAHIVRGLRPEHWTRINSLENVQRFLVVASLTTRYVDTR